MMVWFARARRPRLLPLGPDHRLPRDDCRLCRPARLRAEPDRHRLAPAPRVRLGAEDAQADSRHLVVARREGGGLERNQKVPVGR